MQRFIVVKKDEIVVKYLKGLELDEGIRTGTRISMGVVFQDISFSSHTVNGHVSL